MKDLNHSLFGTTILGALFSLTSCVNTSTFEPEPALADNSTNRIVLNLSAPEDVATRASSNVKLRFVAKLYNGSKNSYNTSSLVRQEMILGEKSLAGVENQMLFDVAAKTNYIIYVFADYIPVESKPDENGYYADYYYDTRSSDYGVSLLATPGNNKTDDISANFFNNDDYDCFSSLEYIERKPEERVDIDLQLERAVAKVRFIDNSDIAGKFDLSVSSTTYIREFDQKNKTGYAPTTKNKTIQLESKKEFKNSGEQEILFFYTFASKYNSNTDLPELTLNMSFPDNVEIPEDALKSNSINVKNIPVEINHYTSVKGKFIRSLFPALEPEEPAYDPNKGYIYLNLSVNPAGWATSESDWTHN